MSTEVQLMTADELLALPRGEFRYELVNGELKKMSPAGQEHGELAVNVAILLGNYVKQHRLGKVYAAETGFKLRSKPDTVLAPDVAFISRAHLIELGETEGYVPGPPDLAVEVNSPSDTVREVEAKVQAWLDFGTRLVWVVSPRLRNVTVYRSVTDLEILSEKDTLRGGDVIPGFKILVAEIFAE